MGVVCLEKSEYKFTLSSINGMFSDNEFSANIKMEYEKVKHSREWRR